MSDRLFQRIDDARDDLIALTQELIAIPTLNPPGKTMPQSATCWMRA